jgi:5'-nucleotidase
MAARKRILLTNDDGYFSSGINALFDELSRAHEVYVVAPDREQSASSHSLTVNRPLRMHQLDKHHYITDGTPTDCVMLALHVVFKKANPDMIISGINHGGNMADDCTYSGTVAAAIEGAILRIPSIAVSMAGYEPSMPMKQAARFVSRLVKMHAQLGLDSSTFLNVNFPPGTGKPYRKLAFTGQGFRQFKDVVTQKKDPRGRTYYWIGGRPIWTSSKGSDFDAVRRGFVSICPMKLDFTDHLELARLQSLTNLKLGGG